MASTYSTNLKLQLMTTGENNTTWGTVTNTNLGTAVEEAIAGSADVTFASGNETLSLSNSNGTQVARHMRLNLTGTTGGSTRTLTVPDVEKAYIVNNGCADAIEVKNSTGSNVSVPAGTSTWVYSTGSNVVDAVTSLTSLAVGGSNVVTLSATQTLTNKTLTAPAVTDLTGSLADGVTATTQSTSDNTTKVATTAYVDASIVTEHVDTTQLVDGAVTTAKIEDDAVTAAKIGDNEVGAAALNVSGDGTSGQVLASDGDGSFSWTAGYDDDDVKTLFSASGSAPVFAARAWARFDGSSGSTALTAGGNIASISRTSTGQYSITFTTALEDTNYAVIATVNGTSNDGGTEYKLYSASQSTGGMTLYCRREETETYVDHNDLAFVVFR